MTRIYLLDTSTLIWAAGSPERLSRSAKRICETERLAVSVASYWELVTAARKKNPPVVSPASWWKRAIAAMSAQILSIRADHVDALAGLPWIHLDPFDRILLAQSIVERMPLVSADAALSRYSASGVELIW